MASEYGITTNTAAVNDLIIQDVRYMTLTLDAAATAAVGQVVQYNTTEDNYDDYTSGMAATHYAVVAEAQTLSGDTAITCIVAGEVRKTQLDATAQADAEIEVALLTSGIRIRPDAVI